MNQFEVEIKTLLGVSQNATKLISRLKEVDPNLVLKDKNNQLNHYFIEGDVIRLGVLIQNQLTEAEQEKIHQILHYASNHSVRTRQKDNKVILVIKASVDDTTSSNGTARIEFEKEFENMSLDDLDRLLIDCDFKYQAKWSRERQEYLFNPKNLNLVDFDYLQPTSIIVCIDKNAGYGYLAEFECLVDDHIQIDAYKTYLRSIMQSLEVEELAQDRLERMFAYYNEHWPEYYGTDKVFEVK